MPCLLQESGIGDCLLAAVIQCVLCDDGCAAVGTALPQSIQLSASEAAESGLSGAGEQEQLVVVMCMVLMCFKQGLCDFVTATQTPW